MIKNFKLLFILIFLNFTNLNSAQEISTGFDAITVSESANGDKTYSLSLKILALMTALTITSDFCEHGFEIIQIFWFGV